MSADPLVIIELFRGWVFFFLQKNQLRVEEVALFRMVARGPLNCESVKSSQQAAPLSGTREGDDGVQMFLPFTLWGPEHSWSPV